MSALAHASTASTMESANQNKDAQQEQQQRLQLRTLTCSLGVLHQSHGSAKFSFGKDDSRLIVIKHGSCFSLFFFQKLMTGKSTVLASVYGPNQTSTSSSSTTTAPKLLQVHLDPLRSASSSPSHRLLESILQSTLEPLILFDLLPRRSKGGPCIQLNLQILSQEEDHQSFVCLFFL